MKKLFILITRFYFQITYQKFDFNKYSKNHNFKNPFGDNEKQILLTIGSLSNYKVIKKVHLEYWRPLLFAFLKPTKEIADFFKENLYYSVAFFYKNIKIYFSKIKLMKLFILLNLMKKLKKVFLCKVHILIILIVKKFLLILGKIMKKENIIIWRNTEYIEILESILKKII